MSAAAASAAAAFETPRDEADITSLASSSRSSTAPSKAADGTPREDCDIAKTKGPKVAPVKIKLPDLSKCHVCGTKFNIFNHRHTCRNCHEPVCNSCARSRKVLRAYTKPKRVCDLCLDKYWSKKNLGAETRKSDDCAPRLTLPAADDTDCCREINSATSPNNSAATVAGGSFIGIGSVGMTSARTLPPPTPVGGDDMGPTPPASAAVRGQAGRGAFFGGRQEGSTSSGDKKLSERGGSVSSSKSDVPAASPYVEKEETPPSLPSLPSTIGKEVFTALSTASSTFPAVTNEDGKVVEDVLGTTETKIILSSPREGMGSDVVTASSTSVPIVIDGREESRDDGLRLEANEASTSDASAIVTNAMASVGISGSGTPQAPHIVHDEVDGVSLVDAVTTSCSSAATPILAVKDLDTSQADNVEGNERATDTKILRSLPENGMGPNIVTDNDGRDGSRLDLTLASTDASVVVTAPIAISEGGDAGLSQALQNKHDDDVDDDLLPASPGAPLFAVVAEEADATGAMCVSAVTPVPTPEGSDISRQGDKVDDASLAEKAEVLLPARETGVGQESMAVLPTADETGDECAEAAHSAENSEEHTVGGSELPEHGRDSKAASDIRETEKGEGSRVARLGKNNARVVCICFENWIGFFLVAVCLGLAVVLLLSLGRE